MKVALLGTAPGSRAVAPFDDQEWEIWACSQGNQGQLPRVTKWFELHSLSALTGVEIKQWSLPYLGWLRSQEFPVYMQEKNDLVPQAIVFPFKKMLELYGRVWFTSTVAWMAAYAIQQMRAGDCIGFFGVDMAAEEEHYTVQRAGLHRFIEIAKERGINVMIPHESDLGQPPPLYGYGEATLMGRKLYHRLYEMEQSRAQMAAQRDKMAAEVIFADGAIAQVKYMIRTFIDGTDADFGPIEPMEDQPKPRPPITTGDVSEQRASGLFVPPQHKES